jgi:hypothetical protein
MEINNVDSRDIRKIFEIDSRFKKKIGSNIFKRVSTRKGGAKTALRTPYYFMSIKDKRKLNGKVDTFNMYETIIKKEKFLEFDTEQQKIMMKKWREKFPVKEIIEEMGVNRTEYYDLLAKLGIETQPIKKELKTVSQEELDKMKNDIVDYETFLSLPNNQRAELFYHYIKNHNISQKELAEIWNTSPANIYNLKYRLDKYISKLQAKEKNKKLVKEAKKTSNAQSLPAIQTINHIIEHLKQDKKQDEKQSENKRVGVVGINQTQSDFYFTINQKGDSKAIIKKLQVLIGLLEDENEEYEINLVVKK